MVLSSLLFGVSSVGLLVDTATAGPQNPMVVQGNAQFNFVGNTFVITAADGTIITYSAFDLSPGQLAQFIQPSANARVLNHIISAVPSNINGDLLANGIVYFVNPAGIIFGNNAVVNVGGIYAAAANIDYADFLAGHDLFTNIAGNVTIQPTAMINATNAAHFIGRQVVNQGTVSVPGGIITMTGHDGSLTIVEAGGHYYLQLQGGSDIGAGNFGVDNSGVLNAGGGQIVLGAGDMYSSAIRLSGSGITGNDVRFDSNVTLGSDVTVSAGQVTFEGTVDGGFALAIDGNVIFNGSVGQLTELASVLVQGDAEIGGDISTTGTQTFNGAVLLLADAVFSGSQIVFEQAVNGGFALTIDGDVIFNAGAGDVAPLMNLLVQGVANIGGDITTIGSQTYADAVNLLTNLVLTGSFVRFESTVDGAYALTINADVFFLNDVNVASVLVDGATEIGADITTTGNQEYIGAVMLVQNALLTGSEVAFRSTVNGAVALVIDGNAVFEGNVGDVNALVSLLVNGLTTIDAASIATTSTQEYVGAVTLLRDALVSGTEVTFGSTVDGLFFLEVDGNAVFEGNVNIGQLLVSGLTTIDAASIATTGAQEYLGAVTILQNAVLTGATVTFRNTVDGTVELEIDGNAVFEGNVNLNQLLVHGLTTIDTAEITTTGSQEYMGAVTLLQNALLTGSSVAFRSTVDGAFALEVNGNAIFEGDVDIAQLLVQGLTTIAADISTTGTQEYVGAVTLAQSALLTGSTVTFRSTIDGAFALEIDGDAVFQGNVDIFSLDVTQNTLVNTELIQTIEHQSYKGLLTLAGQTKYELNAGTAINVGDVAVADADLALIGQSVTLDTDVTVTGGGNLDVIGLFVGGGNVTADQTITIHDDNAFVAGNVHAIAGDAIFQNNSLVAGNVTAGTDVRFGNDGTVGGNVIAGRHVDFGTTGSVLGNVIAGNNVTFGSGATIGDTVNNVDGHVTAGENATFDGGAMIVGDVAAIGGNALFGNGSTVLGNVHASLNVGFGINGSVGGDVDAGENVTFGNNGTVGGNVQAMAGNVQFGNAGSVAGNVAAGDNVIFGNAGNVGGAVLANSNVTFGNNGSVAGNVTAMTGNVQFGNNAAFGGHVTAGQDVTLLGNAAFTGAGNQTVTAQTGSIHAQGNINSNNAGNLTLNAAQQLLANQNITVSNGGLTVNADSARFGANVTTSGSQIINANQILTNGSHTTNNSHVMFNGDVLMQNATTINAGSGNILFSGTVGGQHALVANSSGTTTFAGVVDIATLLTAGGGITRISGGQVLTTGGQIYGDTVVIDQLNAVLAAGGSILFVEAINSAAGQGYGLEVSSGGDITFAKNVGAGANGRLGYLTADTPNGLIFFGSDGGAPVSVLTEGDILLNLNSPGNNDQFATIGAWNDLTFNTSNGNFVMGPNQKMTVLGTLRIEAANGAAYLGDLSAIGDIHATAGQIWLILREAVPGFDQGVDFVAGGQFFFNVSPGIGIFSNGQWIANGGAELPRPQFAGPDADLDANATLQSYLKRVFSRELTRDSDMLEGGRFLDLSSQGVATTDLSTALAAELVDDSETAEVSDEAQLSATDRERLEQMVNLPVRDLSAEELMDFVLGRGLYLDQEARDSIVGLPGTERYAVSIGRLDSRSATIDGVIAAFDRIVRGRDNILYSDSEISDALDMSWDSYQHANPGASARDFVAYLNQRVAEDPDAIDETIALDVIRHLRSFEKAFQAVGPTAREAYRLAIEAQLLKFEGREITRQQLREALYGAN